MATHPRRIGLWLIGATGNVATTVAVGLAALRKVPTQSTGLLTCAEPLNRLDLARIDAIEFGGHDITNRTLLDTATELHNTSRLFKTETLATLRPALRAMQKNIRPGTTLGEQSVAATPKRNRNKSAPDTNRSPREVIDRLKRDLAAFKKRHRLDRVIVVNAASTEPVYNPPRTIARWSQLERALLRRTKPPVPASSLYAIAAIEAGCPFINFTPSVAADLPAIRELAADRAVSIMGADGKTGETLVKTALAPMFRDRALTVESWVSHNVLGNRDGQTLTGPSHKAAKLAGKDRVVGAILGYSPDTHTTIEFVPSFDDWKTSWNHIHFRGFLDTRMTMQFIWQGCDSILAAPLIIDLARLADYHAARGRAGVMTHLACFFKSPMDVAEQRLSAQMDALYRYAEADLSATRSPASRRRR